MPCLTSIFNEIRDTMKNGDENALDSVRKKYIELLCRKTGRNVISYYSSFLKQSSQPNIDINDNDKNMFMSAVHGMDHSKGLDLILHTPGGEVTAAESLVHYLNRMFDGNVRAIVPLMAFSAGSIMACGCKSIVMGKQSNIGPFDPWIGGLSCHNLISEFNEACNRIKTSPHEIELWRPIFDKIMPTTILNCRHGIEMATSIATKWLGENMLKDDPDKDIKIEEIISKLNNPSYTKNHGRHIHSDDAKAMGLVIEELEDDQEFQDLVLSVHHANMILLDSTTITKIVENNIGCTMLIQANG